MYSLFDFTVKNIKGEDWSLDELRGNVVLVVNVASKCGYTKQYKGLEKLYREYGPQGFVIIGAPCNQFGKQEPGTEEEIYRFCSLSYDVTFPLTAKIDVNGDDQAPLYTWLKNATGIERIKWNFEKFLVDRDGMVERHYGSRFAPKLIAADIERLL